jgi:hypothetical protein
MKLPTIKTQWLTILVVLLISAASGPRAPAQIGDGDYVRAVAAIENLGGRVQRDQQRPDHPVVAVDLRMTDVTDKDLVSLEGLKSLQHVSLSSSRITDAGLVHLKGLANLRRLDLDYDRISDAGLVHLEGLTNLRRLDLRVTRVTPAGVEGLQRKLPRVIIDRGDDRLLRVPPRRDARPIEIPRPR